MNYKTELRIQKNTYLCLQKIYNLINDQTEKELFNLIFYNAFQDLNSLILFLTQKRNNFYRSGNFTPQYLSHLKQKLSNFTRSSFEEYMRFFYNSIQKKRITYLPKFFLNKEKHILTFIKNDRIDNFSNNYFRGKNIILSNFKYWIDGRLCLKEPHKFKNSCLLYSRILTENYNYLKINKDFLKKKSYEIISQYLNLTNCIYNQINIRYFPGIIFLGSSGNLFNRIFKRKAEQKKIEVYNFDHGVGNGFYYQNFMEQIEFRDKTNFVCFNNLQKQNIIKVLKNKKIKKINLLTEDREKINVIRRFKKNKIKNVLFVETITKDYLSIIPFINYRKYQYNFEKKLFKNLSDLGFIVTRKPHPYGDKYKEENLKLRVENEKFENIFYNYDLLIFDHFCSSTFIHALHSNFPIIVIDHGNVKLHKSIEKLILQRVQIVKIKIKENYFCLNNNHINKSIRKSLNMNKNLIANL